MFQKCKFSMCGYCGNLTFFSNEKKSGKNCNLINLNFNQNYTTNIREVCTVDKFCLFSLH